MSTFWSLVVPFLVSWLLIYVASYLVTEFVQNYLYDEATKGLAWRVAIGSALLAAIQTWARPSFVTMFTDSLGSTFFQALAWAVVFIFLYRFQPLHGAVTGVALMLAIAGTATLAVDSLLSSGRPRAEVRRTAAPVRRAAGTVPTPVAPGAPAGKAAAPATAK
jgi:hypothetical protein